MISTLSALLLVSACPVQASGKLTDASAANSEIVFVESSVADYQALLAGVKPGLETHVLDSRGDGLAQMAAILAGRSGVGAIHVVSHGSEAALQLGALNLGRQNLEAHAGELATVGSALAHKAGIILYGCEVAKGQDGAAFVSALSRYAHATVAASTDLTGAGTKGGNWTFEYATGKADADIAFSDEAVLGYDGIFINAQPSIDLNGAGSGTGNTVSLAAASGGLAAGTATASDPENDGSNWNGGSLTLQRVSSGGVADGSVNDVFNFVAGGLFSATGGTVVKGSDASGTLTAGTPFATWSYTSATGKLVVSFDSNASSALVQDVVRHIGYSNATPYGDAVIRFGLSDGSTTTNADALVTNGTIHVDQTAYDIDGDAADGFNVAEALAVAKDGDNVLIKDGVYRGQFVATTAVTIDAVNGAAGNVTLEAPDNANMVASPQNNMKNHTRWVILDLRTATPGSGIVTVRNLNIDGRYQGPTQAQDSPPSINMSGIATYDTNAVIDHVNIQHIAALWGVDGDLEGISRDECILAEGTTALGATTVTVTISNSTLGSFQKAGIDAWGANLHAIITNNQITGSGVHGLSAQNGIQIGSFNLDRPGTTAVISGNTIDNLGAPDALVATGYVATGIYLVTAGAAEVYNNTVTLDPGASANSLTGLDVGYGVYDARSGAANAHDNTFNGMSVGIQVDSASKSAIHTFSNNTLTTSGGNPVVYWYDPAGNGDTGGETIANFGPGQAIRVVGENFSSGTMTLGNGTGLAANSVQMSVSGGNTTLYIDTTAAGAVTPITITLNGVYQLANFLLDGEYIRYVMTQTISFGTAPSVVVGGTGSVSATATSGLAVTYTSTTPGFCSVSGTTVTGLAVGTCVIAANQAGNGNYSAAAQVTQDVTVGPTTQTIGSGSSQAVVSTNNWVFDTGVSDGVPRTAGFIATSGDPSGKSPPSLPPGFMFPYGLFDFTLITGTQGSTATITITYPDAVPANAVYWKYGPSPAGYNCSDNCASPHWYPMPSAQVAISGNTIALTIQDGGVGDDDLTPNRVIVDQGGPGIPVSAVPTLSEWGMILLSCLLAFGTLITLRRRHL